MLTPKQEAFVQALVAGKSQRAAYKEAYGARYSDTAIDSMASRLLKKHKVHARYEELTALAAAKTADDATSMRAKIIESYRRFLAINPADFYELTMDKIGGLVLVPKADLTGLDTWAIKDIRTNNKGRVTGYTFYDKDKALERLEFLYGISADELQDNGIKVTMQADLDEYGG